VDDTTLNRSDNSDSDANIGMRERLTSYAENPALMLLGGLAAGFLVGLMLPVTRYESERLRPLAEDVKGRVREASGEVMRRGSEVLKETIDATRDAAVQAIKDQTGEWQQQEEKAGTLSGGTGKGLQQADMDLGPGQ